MFQRWMARTTIKAPSPKGKSSGGGPHTLVRRTDLSDVLYHFFNDRSANALGKEK
jgi:hypothetical protein